MSYKRGKLLAWIVAASMLVTSGASLAGFSAAEKTFATKAYAAETYAAEDAGKSTVVVACSDYQRDDATELENDTKALFQKVKDSGYAKVDGFLFEGDYTKVNTKSESVTKKGLESLKGAFESVFGSDVDEVYVQGNHDSDIGSTGISQGGNNDTDDYGVYVIHEDDYPYENASSSKTKAAASGLKSYLDEKISIAYDKPIFVATHLPLNMSVRTVNQDSAKYAKYIFNVLNDAGGEGLNIIYLFGHDHSHGWEDYLGGGAVFLEKGSKIYVPQASTSKYKEETLTFTYMNSGYVGYYNSANVGADTTLTTTVFTITDDDVTIERYDLNGVHSLKSKGVFNDEYKESTKMSYQPDTTVVNSPKTIKLNKFTPELSGVITGYSGTSELKVTLTQGSTKIAECTPTASTSGYSYKFENLEAGDYTVSVLSTSAADADYFANACDVTVAKATVKDAPFCQLGDTNCDGVRSAEDITRLARHIAKISEESDTYKLKLFNTDRNSEIDAADITHLARFVAKIIEEL